MNSNAAEHRHGAPVPARGDVYSRRRDGITEWWRVAYLLAKGPETYVFLRRIDNIQEQTIATLRELADTSLFERVQAHFRDPTDRDGRC